MKVLTGYRPPWPPGMPQAYQDVIAAAWHPDPSQVGIISLFAVNLQLDHHALASIRPISFKEWQMHCESQRCVLIHIRFFCRGRPSRTSSCTCESSTMASTQEGNPETADAALTLIHGCHDPQRPWPHGELVRSASLGECSLNATRVFAPLKNNGSGRPKELRKLENFRVDVDQPLEIH